LLRMMMRGCNNARLDFMEIIAGRVRIAIDSFIVDATTGLPVEHPPDFVATEAGLFLTSPGTPQGVRQLREIQRIPLLR